MISKLVRVALAVLAGALAELGFGPVFGGFPGPRPFLLALGAATAVALLVALLAAAIRRLPVTIAVIGGTAAVVLAAMGLTGSTVDIVNGPWHLLTGALPTEPTGPALATVVVLAGWSTLAAGLLAGYAAHPLAPAVPPLLCLLAALGLGASGPPLPTWYGLALLALLAGLLVAGRTAPQGPRRQIVQAPLESTAPQGPRRQIVQAPLESTAPLSPALLGAAGVTAAVAVAAAALLGPVAPGLGRPPADARDLIAGPVQPRSGVSPLQQYLALRNKLLPLRVTGTVSRPGSLLRMATLTRFDGTYWTVGGDYRRAGQVLPVGAGPTGRTTVSQEIRVEAGELDWLLTAGRPTRVSVAGLGIEESTGDVAVPIDVAPPAAYTASSAVNDATFDEILAADPAPTTDPVTAPPPPVRSFLDSVVDDQPVGSDQLLALYRQFTVDGGFTYDQAAEAAGGHGYYQIQRLLTGKRGTSEQYASAYAAMARVLGYDARVVMGFRPRYDRDTRGRFVAAGPDVDAWVEVRFTGLGWISIDPSPRDRPIGTRPDAPPALTRAVPLDDPLKEASQTPPPAPPDPVLEGDEGTPISAVPTPSPTIPLLAAAAVALALLIAAGPSGKAIRRARRQRNPSSRLAVLGAWRESLDRLWEVGVPVRPAQTTSEVVLAISGRRGLPAAAADLRALATAVDRAVYAPEEPAQAMRAHAWALAKQVRRRVRAGQPVPRRLRAWLDPRPLLRR